MDMIQWMKRVIEYIWLITLHYLLTPIAWLLYGRKHIWIISERGTDARDNGLYMYRYIRENYPEQRIYFIIDKKSPDYSKVAVLGNVVERGSLMHWLLYLASDVKISTHRNGYVPGRSWRYRQFVSQRESKEKIVFLQHGVIKDDMVGLHKEYTDIRLFICGAKPEYDYILSRYGYTENELKYTGLARFDGLHQVSTKRQVLIMPTWRDWLSPDFSGASATLQDIENSHYFQGWNALLKDKQIDFLARKYDVTFVFYPHYEMQRYLHLFVRGSEKLKIADFAHYDVQQLLKESMLLVTDYSSVFFDFAYMEKPVLYYQFDASEYRAHHYAQGYFDYRRDGFGEVVTEKTKLLELLEQYLSNECGLKAEYKKRIEGFFPLHDDKNCERIYNEIKKL